MHVYVMLYSETIDRALVKSLLRMLMALKLYKVRDGTCAC